MKYVTLDGARAGIGARNRYAEDAYERSERKEWRDQSRHERLRRMRLRRQGARQDWWVDELDSAADTREEDDDE